MDTNEIDLDDLDKSDISSDWNSSEDEAPNMEVEEENPTQPVAQNAPVMNYSKEIEELEQMDNEDDPNYIPSSCCSLYFMARDEERGGRVLHRGGAHQRGSKQYGAIDKGGNGVAQTG